MNLVDLNVRARFSLYEIADSILAECTEDEIFEFIKYFYERICTCYFTMKLADHFNSFRSDCIE